MLISVLKLSKEEREREIHGEGKPKNLIPPRVLSFHDNPHQILIEPTVRVKFYQLNYNGTL